MGSESSIGAVNMIYIQWLLVAIIIVLGFVGGYYHHLIIATMKEGKAASAWFGGWLLYPEQLDKNGKVYRKKIIGCWVVGLALSIIAVKIG